MAGHGRNAPTPEDITTLVELLRLQAGHSYVQLSSTYLGENLRLTQQSASRRLVELERKGMIDRRRSGRGFAVKLTTRGLEAARAYYSTLKGAIEGQPEEITFRGRVFTGFGEGGYYVSLGGYAGQFQAKLGFEPFPGTLNLRMSSPTMLEQRRQLQFLKGIEIQGFEDGSRTYGPVKCFRARFEGQYQAAVLGIERTHYDHSVIEIIAPFNLRKKLGITDGDECYVVTYLD